MEENIFLIGNGPSTTPAVLDKLIGKRCMAVNRISLIYDKTFWRPNYYYKTDYTFGQNWYPEIMPHLMNQEKCMLWKAFRDGAEDGDINQHFVKEGVGDMFDSHVQWVDRCRHVFDGTGFWHPPICLGLNSFLGMAQWAVSLGYVRIFLIGFDGKYVRGGNDHLVDNYYGNEMDVDYETRNNEKSRKAHEIVSQECPVAIYNCSKKSAFADLYQYKSLEDAINA